MMINGKKILVVGAGGFIGGHLVNDLMKQGHEVVCADIKPKEYWFQIFEKNEKLTNRNFRSFVHRKSPSWGKSFKKNCEFLNFQLFMQQ